MLMIFTYLYNSLKKIIYNIIVTGCDQRENILIFKKRLMCGLKINLSDEFDEVDKFKSSDELVELIDLECIKPIKPIHPIKPNFKSNTSPNLTINKEAAQTKTKSSTHLNIISNHSLEIYKPDWYCRVCNRKLLSNANIYCCNDNIFCTPNCRDRFLNFY
jgi:hypothetical protein